MKELWSTYRRLAVAAVILGLISSMAWAQGLTRKGQWNSPPSEVVNHVLFHGTNVVYTTVKALKILNFSDATRPALTGEVTLLSGEPFGELRGIRIVGNYAYVLAFLSGSSSRLYVVDISKASLPSAEGFMELPFVAPRGGFAVDAKRSHVYIAEGAEGRFRIVDVSNPSLPVQVGSFFAGGLVMEVEFDDDIAYAAAEGAGVVIVDVTDPARPFRLGTILNAEGFSAKSVALVGKTLHVSSAAAPGSYKIFDVSDPTNPSRIYSASDFPWWSSVEADSRYALLSGVGSGDSLSIYDVSSPSNAFKLSRLQLWAVDAAVSGNVLAVAGAADGLAFFDISNPREPYCISKYGAGFSFSGSGPDGVVIHNGHAYVRNLASGIDIIDIRNATNLVKVGAYAQFQTNGLPGTGIPTFSGNWAYISTYTGFDVVDVTNPANPTRLGRFTAAGALPDLVVSGSYVYDSFRRIIDVSNPASPQLVGSFEGSAITSMKLAGNIIYAITGLEILTYDISTPGVARLRGNFLFEGATDLTISHPYVYAIHPRKTVVLDVGDPDQIKEVASKEGDINASGWSAIDISGNHLFEGRFYIYGGQYGQAFLVDVSNPLIPRAVTNIVTGIIKGIATDSGRAFFLIANQYGGSLQIFEGDLGPDRNLARLDVAYANGKVVFRWSTNFPNVKLYSSPGFTNWGLVTSTSDIVGDAYVFTNTRPIGNAVFYILK